MTLAAAVVPAAIFHRVTAAEHGFRGPPVTGFGVQSCVGMSLHRCHCFGLAAVQAVPSWTDTPHRASNLA